MLKYLPTPKQLARWRNETTLIITAVMGLVVSLHEFLGPLADADPRLAAPVAVLGGLVQRWRSYGKETIEQDLPALEGRVPEGVDPGDWRLAETPAKRSFSDLTDALRKTPDWGDV